MKFREYIYITVFIYLEHRGSRILRNVGALAPDSTASYHSLGFAPAMLDCSVRHVNGMFLQ